MLNYSHLIHLIPEYNTSIRNVKKPKSTAQFFSRGISRTAKVFWKKSGATNFSIFLMVDQG